MHFLSPTFSRLIFHFSVSMSPQQVRNDDVIGLISQRPSAFVSVLLLSKAAFGNNVS